MGRTVLNSMRQLGCLYAHPVADTKTKRRYKRRFVYFCLQDLLYITVSQSHFGAGNEIRTRDLDLGKVALYQLSYARKFLFCPFYFCYAGQ